MFEIRIMPTAREQLRRIRKTYQAQVRDAIHLHLTYEPTLESASRIKRLRGRQKSTYRLAVGDYRVFYDVVESAVIVNEVLHKGETLRFYEGGEA